MRKTICGMLFALATITICFVASSYFIPIETFNFSVTWGKKLETGMSVNIANCLNVFKATLFTALFASCMTAFLIRKIDGQSEAEQEIPSLNRANS